MYQTALLFSPFCGVITQRFLLPMAFLFSFLHAFKPVTNVAVDCSCLCRRSNSDQSYKTEVQCNSIAILWEVGAEFRILKFDPTQKVMEPSEQVDESCLVVKTQ